MRQVLKNTLVLAAIGIGVAGIVTGCVKNSNDNGVSDSGPVALKTSALKFSDQVNKFANEFSYPADVESYSGKAHKIASKVYDFDFEKTSSLAVNSATILTPSNCPGQPTNSESVTARYILLVNGEAPGQAMSLGQFYDIPAGQHQLKVEINNPQLCGKVDLSFFAELRQEVVNINPRSQKYTCKMVNMPNQEALIQTRPFEFAVINQPNTRRSLYYIDQREFNSNPVNNEKIFCFNELHQARCSTQEFKPSTATTDYFIGFNTQCSGNVPGTNKVFTSSPANLTIEKMGKSGNYMVLGGQFSCFDAVKQVPHVRELRDCKLIYDHGPSILEENEVAEGLQVHNSCAIIRIKVAPSLNLLQEAPTLMYWNLYDAQLEQYVLKSWQWKYLDRLMQDPIELRRLNQSSRRLLQTPYRNLDFRKLLPRLKVVFSPNPGSNQNDQVYHLPLGEYLQSHPEAFTVHRTCGTPSF